MENVSGPIPNCPRAWKSVSTRSEEDGGGGGGRQQPTKLNKEGILAGNVFAGTRVGSREREEQEKRFKTVTLHKLSRGGDDDGFSFPCGC